MFSVRHPKGLFKSLNMYQGNTTTTYQMSLIICGQYYKCSKIANYDSKVKHSITLDGSPGLVVVGGDSCSKGR